jgi:hypothetical protein
VFRRLHAPKRRCGRAANYETLDEPINWSSSEGGPFFLMMILIGRLLQYERTTNGFRMVSSAPKACQLEWVWQ